jgi:hypothetical protein
MPLAGTKLFAAGEVLTALNVQYYLMDQTIMGFTSTASRDAAFGGAGEPTLAEGMFAYTSDTDTLWLYNGSAWVPAINAASLNGVGNWTSYTPILTATTNPTLGTGSAQSGSYARIQDLIIYRFLVAFGSSGFSGGSGFYKISLPVPASGITQYYEGNIGTTTIFDASVPAVYYANAWIADVNNITLTWQSGFNGPLNNVSPTAPITIAAGDSYSGLIVYRAA